ncbi:hypothetical protein IWW36_000589 [Coemansia brasiliensis]|uniref:Uncharacterized protein n=1 Tax=Coemansia brasiliensis TaxID=2650707 RepID=A0A9W8IIA2_9FUNG|nr:hypothetical protein IWW36_000589 [Coemansia brasiliensis]
MPDPCFSNLVRQVKVRLDLESVINGSALKHLQTSAEQHMVYPRARELDYEIYFAGDDNDFNMLGAYRAIAQFLDMIDKMAPNASIVDVDIKAGSNPYYQITREALNNTLHRLFSSATQRQLKVRPGTLHAIIKPTMIQGLTSIYAVEIGKFGQLASLLHRNALTLQSLHLSFFSAGCISDMIYDGKHEVEYPVLQKLAIHWPPTIVLPLNKPTTSKPLFPALRYLNVGGLYPFADTVLLRGNDCILEYLSINAATIPSDLHAEVSMLIQRKTSLRFLKIANSHQIAGIIKYLPLSLQTLKLGQISDLLSSQEGFFPVNLVKLTIGVSLTIIEMTQLLKLLPNLSYLSSGYVDNKLLSRKNENTRQFIRQLQTRKFPASYSLRHWQAHGEQLVEWLAALECAVLLAALCPGFILSQLDKLKLDAYDRTLWSALDTSDIYTT